mmetsp:Transcript_77210/g.218512  ORF Transcript_77210/g.218512 Transcript_77210/m.218512 type:complete len:236 (-) Transcript_77210:254-961(-)
MPYFPAHSAANPPPIWKDRSFMAGDSWFPRNTQTLPGHFSMNAKRRDQISTACWPRSQMSPLTRYTFVGEGGPCLSRIQSTSASWPCVSPTSTVLPPGTRGTGTSTTAELCAVSSSSTRPSSTRTTASGSGVKGASCSRAQICSGSMSTASSLLGARHRCTSAAGAPARSRRRSRTSCPMCSSASASASCDDSRDSSASNSCTVAANRIAAAPCCSLGNGRTDPPHKVGENNLQP